MRPKTSFPELPISRYWRQPVVLSVLFMAAMPIKLFAEVDAEADRILRDMSNYMASMETFKIDADASTDVIFQDGRKIQLTGYGTALVDRDGGLRFERQSAVGKSVLTYNGTVLSLFNEALNSWAEFPVEGGIDEAIDELRTVLGAEVIGGADLLYSDPYPGLMLEVESGEYLGETIVGGERAHHLSFRAAEVDWQLWIAVGEDPVPVKYVITSKWLTGAPQFMVQFSGFDSGISIAPDTFDFEAPEGSRRIDVTNPDISRLFVVE